MSVMNMNKKFILLALSVAFPRAPVTLSYAGSLANHITAQIAWTNHVKGILKNLE